MMMKTIQYYRYGDPEVLQLDEVALPKAGRGQVLVRVKAASFNPMDGKIRRGEMRALTGSRFPRALGHDFAGVVEALGPEVDHLKVGDEVFGVTSLGQAGAFSEYVAADERSLWIKPPSATFEQAAALGVVSITAWNALVEKAKLGAGQSILITGCLGGVGRSAVQLARILGATVVGSCNASGREEAIALGVDEALDYRNVNISQLRHRFDVIFDTAGALSLSQCATMLKRHGKSLHIVPSLAKMLGCLLPSRHYLVFGNATPPSLAGIADAMGRGKLVPAIGRTVRLSEAISAMADLEKTGLPKGKLVVVPDR